MQNNLPYYLSDYFIHSGVMSRRQNEISGNVIICGSESTLHQCLGILTRKRGLHLVNYYKSSLSGRQYSGGQVTFVATPDAEEMIKDVVLLIATIDEEETRFQNLPGPLFEFSAFLEW